MEPLYTVEYELTTELAAHIERTLSRYELRRGWRHDIPGYVAAVVFAALIIWLGLQGWIVVGVGSALLFVLTLLVMGAVWRRLAISRGAAFTALLALHTTDRRVRIEFAEERVRLETEYFRGEGAWTELDEVIVFTGFWALRLSNGGLVVIPAPMVSPELEAFIRTKAQRNMAPIASSNLK
jgi:hypothetical protein